MRSNKHKFFARIPFEAGSTSFFGFHRRAERRADRHNYNQYLRTILPSANMKDETEDGPEYIVDAHDEPVHNFHEWREQADHLAPLYRFLMSHIGQPWNDVFSKIARRANKNTLAGDHVLLHTDGYVETDPVKIGRNTNWMQFYVEDGILHFKDKTRYHSSGVHNVKTAMEWAGTLTKYRKEPVYINGNLLMRNNRIVWKEIPYQIMPRKVINANGTLFWGELTNQNSYRQSLPLTEKEVKFYNNCTESARAAVTHISNKEKARKRMK